MRRTSLYLLILLALLVGSVETYAQISASTTQGCAPLGGVTFSNAYDNPTNILWDFGDATSSNLPNPSKSYINPGIFTVTFSAIVNGVLVEDNLIITVFELPSADFSVDPDAVCLGEPMSFTDFSSGGSGSNITQWLWNFGNGITDNSGPNPTYTYPNSGAYTVSLSVTDGNGCSNNITANGAAVVSETPNISVLTSPNPPAACEAPLTVSFTNNSSSNSPSGGGLTYSWTFGEGTTSDAENPAPVTYDENGIYTVTITGTDNAGCSGSQIINVSVQEPTAGITAIGAEDGVVCSDVEFIVEGTTGGIFNYGDGNVGSSPSHTYTSAGEYTVTYSVNVSGCSASGSTTFNVEIPTATIVSTPGFGCEIPAEFSYTLESEFDITEQEWSFAGQNGTETNPLNSTLANPSTVFTYDDDNEFSINGLKLLFTSATFVTDNGCVGTASTNVDTVALPNALAYVDIDQGCAPLDVSFTNESSYLFPENLVNAVWHFGDGNTAETGPDEDIQYTYTSTGEFEAFVVVTTTEGCIDTSFFHDIMVGEEIIPSFTISPDDICRDDSVTLTNTSADIDLIDAYSYSADLNTLSSCSDEENPTFAFNDFAGTAEITQFVEYNGCISSSTQSVDVAGPVGKIHYTCDCSTPFEYTFTLFDQNGNLQVYDADSWTWDFGDGTTIENSTETEVTHTYAETGDYEAALTTFNDATGCDPHTSTVLIKVRDLKASLQFDTLACAGTTVSFSAVDLQDVASNNGGCYRNYLWDFGDNTRPVKTLGANEEHVFQNGGDYTVSLSVKDDNECVITTAREISIFGIQASYEADTLVGCLPLEVNFTDLSTADTTIVSWNWDFDINGNFSDEQNPTFTFEEAEFVGANPQVYDIVLTVTDALGCTDVVNTLNITPQVPNPAFFASSSTDICVGEDVSFQPANNLATNTYNWDYGNGSTSEGALGNTIYNEPGQYSVFLSVTDNLGCFNEDSLIAVVDVQAFPIPEIASIVALTGDTIGPDTTLCYPIGVSFSNLTSNQTNDDLSLLWELEGLDPLFDVESVGDLFNLPGNYSVSLTVETSYGCAADTTIFIDIEGPVATFIASPDAICPGGSVELELLDTADVAIALYDFTDGVVALTEEMQVGYSYDPEFIPDTLFLNVIVYNETDTASACKFGYEDFVLVEPVTADFDRNNETSVLDSIHCFGTEDIFTSTSTPNATQFFWSVDGVASSNTQDFNTNLNPGEYVIELIVNSELGCADTIAKSMEIFPLPEPTVNQGTICRGETIELIASGGTSYSWTPTEGLDDPNSGIVQASPESSVTYIVTATDDNDCSASVSSFVLVYQPPPSISVDTTLIIGDTATTGLNLGMAYTYLWTPDFELECATCPITDFRPLEDRTYTLSITDTLGCFTENSFFTFKIREVASVVVPDAFSPNGDGVNDVVFVEGWGIEELISFQIYNRWGELIFETTDQNEGWDGTYKGEIQNPDSYAYVIKAKNFIRGNPETFKGFIDLVR